MAKYQQYDEYKDSGVVSIGLVPKNWSVSRLKQVVDQNRQVTYGIVQAGPNVKEGVYYIRPADMTEETGVKNYENLLKTSPEIAASYERSKIKAGDIICSIGPSFGKLMITPEYLDGANLTQGTARVAISSEYNTGYFFWALRSTCSFQQWESSVGGATFRALNLGPLADTFLAIPTNSEQAKIANFLDFETAQIDTLIEKQQTLIQLLKEKRQAVISHAVTKGLNPDAPMKDSGVEWLGEVPEHWQVKRIKHYGKIMGGFAFKSDDFIDSGYPVLKISNVSHLQLNFDDESFLPLSFVEKHLEYKVEENDLVFAMTRPIISGGIKVAKIPKLEAMPLVNQRVGFLKLKSELLADFILYSSLSSSFKAQFKNNMTITNQPNISGEGIESVALPMPPKNELVEIVDFLNNSETVFQNLSIKSEQQVELLKERRTALISAAVTGKIDVRGWVAPE